MRRITHILIFLTILLYSCEYEPEGLYEAEVEPVTEAPEITVNLNFVADTVYVPVNGYTTLVYSTPDSKIRYAHFSLNNKQLTRIESTSGTFTFSFNSGQYQKGITYELKVELFRSTGSGSLADKLYAEGFIYSRSFYLIFEDESKMAPQVTRVYPHNGSLRVEWEKFKGFGFKKFHVFNSTFYKIDIISDPDKNFLYDESYVGYNGDYYVVTETDNNTFTSNHVYFEEGLPEATAEHTVGNKVEINWGQSKFVNNISGYRIFESYNRYNHFNELAWIEGGVDTSFIFEDGRFAVATRFYIQPIPVEREIPMNSYDDLRYMASTTEDVLIGDKMPVFPFDFFHNPPGNFCYFSNIDKIFKFDCSKNTIADSIETQYIYMSVSPDGKTILSSHLDRLEIIDANSMEITNMIREDELPEGTMPYQFLTANNGKGVFSANSGNYYYYDYNLKKSEALFRIDGESNIGDKMRISPDGKYFCIRHIKGIYPNYLTELYKLENGEAVQIWNDNEVEFFDFDPTSGQFVYYKDGKILFASPENLSTVSELAVNDDFFYDIDWSNREYICLNNDRDLITIYDLNTGTAKTRVKTYNFGGYNSNYEDIFLSNKIIFTQGLKLKLDY